MWVSPHCEASKTQHWCGDFPTVPVLGLCQCGAKIARWTGNSAVAPEVAAKCQNTVYYKTPGCLIISFLSDMLPHALALCRYSFPLREAIVWLRNMQDEQGKGYQVSFQRGCLNPNPYFLYFFYFKLKKLFLTCHNHVSWALNSTPTFCSWLFMHL